MAVNYIAIVVTAVAVMVLGALWYSPVLFGRYWMRLAGKTEKDMAESKKQMPVSYAIGFLATFVMVYVLSRFIGITGSTTFSAGAITGFWIWLGFQATLQVGSVLWEGKPRQLFFLNTIFRLIAIALAGGILAVWV